LDRKNSRRYTTFPLWEAAHSNAQVVPDAILGDTEEAISPAPTEPLTTETPRDHSTLDTEASSGKHNDEHQADSDESDSTQSNEDPVTKKKRCEKTLRSLNENRVLYQEDLQDDDATKKRKKCARKTNENLIKKAQRDRDIHCLAEHTERYNASRKLSDKDTAEAGTHDTHQPKVADVLQPSTTTHPSPEDRQNLQSLEGERKAVAGDEETKDVRGRDEIARDEETKEVNQGGVTTYEGEAIDTAQLDDSECDTVTISRVIHNQDEEMDRFLQVPGVAEAIQRVEDEIDIEEGGIDVTKNLPKKRKRTATSFFGDNTATKPKDADDEEGDAGSSATSSVPQPAQQPIQQKQAPKASQKPKQSKDNRGEQAQKK
jgi:hypothetical protein